MPILARSMQTLMDDAVLFQTARPAGKHLGPGSYDLPSTLTNGEVPRVFFSFYFFIPCIIRYFSFADVKHELQR